MFHRKTLATGLVLFALAAGSAVAVAQTVGGNSSVDGCEPGTVTTQGGAVNGGSDAVSTSDSNTDSSSSTSTTVQGGSDRSTVVNTSTNTTKTTSSTSDTSSNSSSDGSTGASFRGWNGRTSLGTSMTNGSLDVSPPSGGLPIALPAILGLPDVNTLLPALPGLSSLGLPALPSLSGLSLPALPGLSLPGLPTGGGLTLPGLPIGGAPVGGNGISFSGSGSANSSGGSGTFEVNTQ